jgi:hypothetical protein
MRPPICEICDERFDDGGGLVTFALDDRARAFHKRRKREPGFVGHPPEKEWFCEKHIEAARALSHLTRGEAVAQLKASPGPAAQ